MKTEDLFMHNNSDKLEDLLPSLRDPYNLEVLIKASKEAVIYNRAELLNEFIQITKNLNGWRKLESLTQPLEAAVEYKRLELVKVLLPILSEDFEGISIVKEAIEFIENNNISTDQVDFHETTLTGVNEDTPVDI
jgi:hypothetical protein